MTVITIDNPHNTLTIASYDNLDSDHRDSGGHVPLLGMGTMFYSEAERDRVSHEPLLAEVDLLLNQETALNRTAIDEYVFANELSSLVEGIQGGVSQYTSVWNDEIGDFVAGGKPLDVIFMSGIAFIAGTIEAELDPNKRRVLEIELKRRQYECKEHMDFIDSVKSGEAHSRAQITFSPFPEEAHSIDTETTKALGYNGADKTWKMRVSWYDSNTKKKTTVEFFSKQSSIHKIQHLAKRVFGLNMSHMQSSTDFLAHPQWVSSDTFPTWYSVMQEIAPFFYDQSAHSVIDESYKLLDEAQLVAQRLVNLDKELAESLKMNAASPAVRQLIYDYYKLKQLDESHISGSFTRELAARIKKFEIITALTELAIRTNNTKNLGSWAQKYTISADPTGKALRSFIAANPVEYVVCGASLSSSMYTWGVDGVKTMLFASEQRVTRCPICGKDNLLDSSHIQGGIQCWNCSAQVPSGAASRCVIEASPAPNPWSRVPKARYADQTESSEVEVQNEA